MYVIVRKEEIIMITNTISPELKEKIDNMSSYEQDQIYRYLWAQHIREDVESLCEEEEIELNDGDIDLIVEKYVYEGKYDCNLSYWTNLENLIDEIS